MKLYFLGTGTSTGVPQMGCPCPVCHSSDPHDRRLRTSALVENPLGHRLLIDCGPDFREQMLRIPFHPIDAVVITHDHYDHVGGLDDLRPFSAFGETHVFAAPDCAQHLRERLPYCFIENKYPGVPQIDLQDITSDSALPIPGWEVTPIHVMHGALPILGYRIGSLVYVTDMTEVNDEEKNKMRNADCLVVNALRLKPHRSHQGLFQALELIEELQPKVSYLIHMSHEIGLQRQTEKLLPPNVHFAYDGLEITF